MDTLVVEVKNKAVMKWLEDMKNMDLLNFKRLSTKKEIEFNPEKYIGILNKKTAKKMLADVDKSRNEWNTNTF